MRRPGVPARPPPHTARRFSTTIWVTQIGRRPLTWVSVLYLLSCSTIQVGISASTISKKYLRAVKEEDASHIYFEGISQAAPQELIPVWKAEIEKAETGRQRDPKIMDIYQVKVDKGLFFFYSLDGMSMKRTF